MEKYKSEVGRALNSREYIIKLNSFPDKLPLPKEAKRKLEETFHLCSERKKFRLTLVEDFKDYKIFLQIPNEKSECDFQVWYANFANTEITEYKIPTHDNLAKWYSELKKDLKNASEYLINAVIKLIRDRVGVQEIVQKYFLELNQSVKIEIFKFLSTLKWISLQEDVNYPPPKLGSKYTLAVYVLLEAGFNWREIRKIIRF